MSSPGNADIPDSPDAYAAWVNRRIGQEVLRRRTAIGLSAYALAKQTKLTAQSIRNIELGKCPTGSLSTSLARSLIGFRPCSVTKRITSFVERGIKICFAVLDSSW
jgi:hypothetical protein